MAELAESTGYGAIDVPEGTDNYNEKNAYYLNESRFNWGRFFRAVVPIVIALVIMGGFAYGMSHGFNHFYGPPKGRDDDIGIKHEESWIPDDSSAVKSSGKKTKSSGASCSANEKCTGLGLTGKCCPTGEGVMLGCCD